MANERVHSLMETIFHLPRNSDEVLRRGLTTPRRVIVALFCAYGLLTAAADPITGNALPADCLQPIKPTCPGIYGFCKGQAPDVGRKLLDTIAAQCQYSTGSACGEEQLGEAYESGDALERNFKTAASHYDKACASGNGRACIGFARLIEAGEAAESGSRTASDLFENSCTGGKQTGEHGHSICGLGALRKGCLNGKGADCTGFANCFLSPNSAADCQRHAAFPKVGKKYLERGCQQNDAGSCFALAMHHLPSGLLPLEPWLAIPLLEKSCRLNGPSGCAALADIYNVGRFVKRDPVKADGYLLSACRKGIDPACHLLIYKRGCEQGSAESCLLSGRFYSTLTRSINLDGSRETEYHRLMPDLTQWYSAVHRIIISDVVSLPNGQGPTLGLIARDEETAAGYFQKGCELGSKLACRYAAWQILLKPEVPQADLAKAEKLLEPDCAMGLQNRCVARDWGRCVGGIRASCAPAAKAIAQLRRDQDQSLPLYLRGCNAGDFEDCFLLKHYSPPILRSIQVSQECAARVEELTSRHYIPLCTAGDPDACLHADGMLPPPPDPDFPLRQKCLHSDTSACEKYNKRAIANEGRGESRSTHNMPDDDTGNYGTGGRNPRQMAMENRLRQEQPGGLPPENKTYRALSAPGFEKRCAKKDGAACEVMGDLLRDGFINRAYPGMTNYVSVAAANNWYQKACDLRVLSACLKIIRPYTNDETIPIREAACNLGDAQSCFETASGYRWGKPRTDLAEYRRFLDKACDLDSAAACDQLSEAEVKGRDLPKIPAAARTHAERSCTLGNDSRCLELQAEKDCNVGNGLACAILSHRHKDDEASARKACVSGEPMGCYYLGLSERNKSNWQSWKKPLPPDPGKIHLKIACKAGVPAACGQLEPPIFGSGD